MRKQLFIMWFLILGIVVGQSGTNRGSQRFSDWYKSTISITGSNNETVDDTLRRLQDGVGNYLPFSVNDSDVSMNGGYILNEQGSINLRANSLSSPYYRFDGVDDDITIGDINSDLYSAVIRFYLPSDITYASSSVVVIGLGTASIYAPGIYLGATTSSLVNELITIYTVTSSNGPAPQGYISPSETIKAGWHTIAISWNAVAGKYDLYLDGVQKTVTTSATPVIINANNVVIGDNSLGTGSSNIIIDYVALLNTSLIASEVKEFMTGPIPYKYQVASQTNLYSPGTFEGGTEGWSGSATVSQSNEQVHSGTYSLKITQTGGNYERVSKAATTIEGKLYEVVLYVYKPSGQSGSFRVRCGKDVENAGEYYDQYFSTYDSWVEVKFTFIALSSTTYLTVNPYDAVSSSDYLYIDDVTMRHPGIVAEYDGTTMGHNQWGDKQNGLYGTVNGPTLENTGLPHSELYTRNGVLEVSGETTLTDIIPAGYQIASITYKNTTANAITSFDIGFTDGGGEVVAATSIGANAVGTLTIAQGVADLDNNDTVYLSASAWNAGSLELYFTFRRIK